MSEDFNKNSETNSLVAGKSIEKSAPQAAEENNFAPANFIPLILIFVIFYFFIIRPQSKKHRQHQETINNLKIGEVVVTTSGIIGKIKSNPDKNSLFDKGYVFKGSNIETGFDKEGNSYYLVPSSNLLYSD